MGFPRSLTAEESSILLRLLDAPGVGEREALKEQAAAAFASEPCGCGCPSVSLSVDPSRARRVSYTARPVASADWPDGGIMVFVDEGWLSLLEIWWHEQQPHAWPPAASINNVRAG